MDQSPGELARFGEHYCSGWLPASCYGDANLIPTMSERSIYLRDQAVKCRGHADSVTDLETQAALRKLATEYVAQAEAIEAQEPGRLKL
jgi:hypothetical protein